MTFIRPLQTDRDYQQMRSDFRETRPWLLGGVATALVVASVSAQAQTTNAEAEQIAAALKRYIDDRILQPSPELSLDLDGPIEVRAMGDHYAGMIPSGSLLVDIDHGNVAVFDFREPLTFEIRVTDRGWYDTTFVVPSSVRISGEGEPEEAVTFTIGSQSGTALIMPEFETTASLDSIWSDMSMQVANMSGGMTISEIALWQQSEEIAEGVFDSEFSLDMSGFNIAVPDEDVLIELDEAGFFGAMAGVDYPAILPFSIALNELIPQFEENPEDPALYEELRVLIAETPNFIADFEGTYFLEGLRVDTPDVAFSVTEASTGGALTGLDSDQATVALTLNMAGLEIQPPLPFENLLPVDTGYEIRLVDVPTDALLTWIDSLLLDIPVVGADEAFENSLPDLYSQIASSGAYLEIADIHYDAEAGGLAVMGEVSPDTSAMFGVTAGVEMIVTNMAQFIQAMQSLPDFGGEAAAGFTVIQTLGSMETNERGEPIHVYQLEVTRDGAMTLNGNDLGPIIGQMQ